MSMPRAKIECASRASHGIDRALTWIDAWSLPGALFAVSAQIVQRILLDSALKQAASLQEAMPFVESVHGAVTGDLPPVSGADGADPPLLHIVPHD